MKATLCLLQINWVSVFRDWGNFSHCVLTLKLMLLLRQGCVILSIKVPITSGVLSSSLRYATVLFLSFSRTQLIISYFGTYKLPPVYLHLIFEISSVTWFFFNLKLEKKIDFETNSIFCRVPTWFLLPV